MKTKQLLIISACLATLVGCTDESLLKKEKVVSGSQVSFKVGLSKNSDTRTVYAEDQNSDNTWSIYWIDGDKVNIYSPDLDSDQSPYKISVDGSTQNYATGITTVNANGIQWGDETPSEDNPVRFYSVFPESYKVSFGTLGETTTNTLTKNSDENEPVTANLNIRRNQIMYFTAISNHPTSRIGLPIDRASNTTLSDCQQNPDAIMYAQTKQTESGDVYLTYNPLSTALHFKIFDITGPNTDGTAVVYGFKLHAPEGVQLAGDFTATFNEDCTTAPTIKGNYETGDNEITISTLQDISGRYLTVSTADTRAVEFNVFVVPLDDIQITDEWWLEIETDYGDYYTNFTIATTESDDSDSDDSTDSQTGLLKPGYIHTFPLATINLQDGNYELNPDSWMSEIPDNVYVTELTIPGAWYATEEEYQGDVTIASLYDAGVRAFTIETKSSGSSGDTSGMVTPTQVVISGTQNNQTVYDGCYGGTAISSTIEQILTQVAKTPEEFAVLILSYADGGSNGQNTTYWNFWPGGIEEQIKTAMSQTYTTSSGASVSGTDLVFGQNDGLTFSPSTVVGDARGKLIIKINMDERFTESYTPTIPAIFSQASYTWVTDLDDTDVSELPLMSHGYWKSWQSYTDESNPGYAVNLNFSWDSIDTSLADHNDGLHFAYTNANRTYHIDENDTTTTVPSTVDIPTSVDRQNSINTIVNTSERIYNAGAHNVWFQIGAGGVRADKSTGSTYTNGGQHIAVHFNQFFYYLITAKIERNSPSPLGLVLCNYISQTATVTDKTSWSWSSWSNVLVGGGTIGGDYSNTFDGTELIEQILLINNLFYLQRDPNWTKTTTAEASVQSVSANHSSAFVTNTDTWTAF